MPRIPQYQQQTVASGGLDVRPNLGNPGAGLAALAQGIGAVVDTVTRQRESDALSDASVRLSKAQSDWQRTLLERQQQAEPGAPDFTPNLLKDYDTYAQETLKQARSQRARLFLQERLADFRTDLSGNALKFEAAARTAHNAERLDTALQNFGTSVDLDPDSWPKRAAEAAAFVDAADLTPIEREAKRKGAIEFITKRAAIAYGRRDPDAAMQRLTQPAENDALFRSLSPEARDALHKEIEGEQRARWSAEDQDHQRQQRAEQDMHDAAAKDMDKQIAGGGLSARWLEQNRGRLSPSDYRYGYRALAGDDSVSTNPAVYVDLRERASAGQDVRTEARDALLGGRIKRSDYDRLMGEVEQSRPNWYRRGASYLTTVSGYSDLNPTPAAAQTKAAMLDDWDEWARGNPKATEDQAHEAYQRIARERSLIDYQTMTITMRAPRFLVGTRVQPNLDETERRTVEEYKAGRIDRAEFDRQAKLLADWRRALRPVTEGAAK